MSVSVAVNLSGDFEGNERHEEVAHEILEAVKAVIARQPDLAYQPTISINESRSKHELRQPDGSYKESTYYQYARTLATVYHINKPAVQKENAQPLDGN